jgi:hypothetical protein
MKKMWHNLKNSISARRYYIKLLKENGCYKFRDFFRIMFSRNLINIKIMSIDRLAKLYEGIFEGFEKRNFRGGSGVQRVRMMEKKWKK